MTNFSSGYNPAAHIWSAVMNRIHNGLSKKNFELDDQIVERSYCTRSGLLAGSGCPKAVGYYDKDHLPDTCSGRHSGGLSSGEVKTTRRTYSTTGSGSTSATSAGGGTSVPSVSVPSVTQPPIATTTAAVATQ